MSERHYTDCTPEKRARFLELLTEGRTVTASAEEVCVSRSRLYQLRREDADFSVAWDEAAQMGADVLEDEARRRAVEGTLRYKFDKHGDALVHPETGQPYIEREYSDTLLIFLLKAARPDKYRERAKIEHVGANDGPIQVQAVDYRQAIAPLAPDAEAG